MNFEELVASGSSASERALMVPREFPAALRRVIKLIRYKDRNSGFGYCGTSDDDEEDVGALVDGAVCGAFKDRGITPVLADIDTFYQYATRGTLSIVGKVQRFDEDRLKLGLPNEYAIILSGFGRSAIFESAALRDVPFQDNADLNIARMSGFGRRLLAASDLSELIARYGDLDGLRRILSERFGEDGRLFLVVSLLLQDRQAWQNLWYESARNEGGTSLFLVAPPCFHDAMNRLNCSWGHGAVDYSYRATLGRRDQALYGDEDKEAAPYYTQGLPAEEFERRMRPVLDFAEKA